MNTLKPRRLRKGDCIGLVAPASAPSNEEKIEKAVCYLESLGYRVKVGDNVRKVRGYLAGSDEERAADFNNMVRDKNVKAIFALRGGFGSPRILQKIDYRMLRQNPKIIVGYSDITALQLAVMAKSGIVTFSGPMPSVEMWNDFDKYTEENLWRLLTSAARVGVLKNPEEKPLRIMMEGKGRGRLLGGNCSLVTSLMGTSFLPKLQGAVLVLEDTDEAPHRIDRMFAHLLNSGVLRRLSALLLGEFTNCVPSDPSTPNLTINEVISDYASLLKCPVIANLQYGHIPRKLTLPWGLQTAVDTKRGRIEVLESAVV